MANAAGAVGVGSRRQGPGVLALEREAHGSATGCLNR